MTGLFGTAGIRGIYGEKITPGFFYELGKALAVFLGKGKKICIGNDSRKGNKVLKNALMDGLLSSGVSVFDLGLVPTPLVSFAVKKWSLDSGAVITASHNPPNYNGIKLLNKEGMAFSSEDELKLELILKLREYIDTETKGELFKKDITNSYIEDIRKRVGILKPFKILIDASNGASGILTEKLFRELGIDVFVLNKEPKEIPNHDFEPIKENLTDTEEFFKKNNFQLGICLDGDGDRTTFITKKGFVPLDTFSAFFAYLRTKKDNGGVVSSIDCSMLLDFALSKNNSKVIRTKVGDKYISSEMKKNKILTGIEPCGHMMLSEMNNFPDPIYGSAWLLSKLDNLDFIDTFIESLPKVFFKRNKIECINGKKIQAMEKIMELTKNTECTSRNIIDGIRLDFSDKSWFLIRASGTEEIIRYSAEAMDENILNKRLIEVETILTEALK